MTDCVWVHSVQFMISSAGLYIEEISLSRKCMLQATAHCCRLPQLCQEYHQTKGRAERIAFLQRLLKASEGGPGEGLPSLAPCLTIEEAEGQQMPEGVFRRRKTLEKIRL